MRLRIIAVVLTAAAGASCATVGQPGPRVVQPGAPGESSRVAAATPPATTKYADADVKFMAKRIEVSQADEIRRMQRWLAARSGSPEGAR